MSDYAVRAVRCGHQEPDSRIEERLRDVTAPLAGAWERIEKARKILVKTNMVYPPDKVRYFHGRRREHVDDSVMRVTLSLLRERTDAEICVIDTSFWPRAEGALSPEVNFQPLLEEFGARYIDGGEPRLELYDVPGGGLMFDRYLLHSEIREADAFVSVAKLKNHHYMGLTACTKNLFGLPPMEPHGRDRTYFHHLIRLPYVLVDLAKVVDPCLNIIDALLAQSGSEWGGDVRVTDALIAGDHPIATDACAGLLMGHDPHSDWPTPPFRRDRNHLLAAANRGFGTVDTAAIDFESEVSAPMADFDTLEIDPPELVFNWRRTMCEQALYYRDNRERLVDRYAGEYIFLQAGEVIWHGPDPSTAGSRRVLAGSKKEEAIFIKLADPLETEGEHYEVYEENLRMMLDMTGAAAAP